MLWPGPSSLRSICVLVTAVSYGTPVTGQGCPLNITAAAGDTCTSVAAANGISVTQFILGNPLLTNCRLTAGKPYCIDKSQGVATHPPSTSLMISPDGSCGGGYTCVGSTFGDCCSRNGYCGTSIDYCGTGCKAEFGACPGAVSPGVSKCDESGTKIVTSTSLSVVVSTSVITVTSTSTSTQLDFRSAQTITILTVVYDTPPRVTVSELRTITTTFAAPARTLSFTQTEYQVVTVMSVVYEAPIVTTVTQTSTRTIPASTVTVSDVHTTTRIQAFATRTFTETVSSVQVSTVTAVAMAYSTPTPIHDGTYRQCKYLVPCTDWQAGTNTVGLFLGGTFHYVTSTDTCRNIIVTYGITMTQLYTWNPMVLCPVSYVPPNPR